MSDFAEENRKMRAEGYTGTTYPRLDSAGVRGAKAVAREQLGHGPKPTLVKRLRTEQPIYGTRGLSTTQALREDAADRIEALEAELAGEREGRAKLDKALREKDAAMGVLFDRLNKAGVDYSDLIS